MARHSMSALYLAGLFLLCYCVPAKSRRYGSLAKTLHMSSLIEAEKSGKKVVVMHAESTSEDLSDDVDKLLRRFRRSATQTDEGIQTTAAPLRDNHSMLIVHWAGEGSSVIIALAKSSRRSRDGSSKVYLSQDYGKTFQNITDRLFGSTQRGVIDKYYNSDLSNSHYVFTELQNKCVITTQNYARTFTRNCGLPFTPRTISINPHNAHHILAYDEQAPNSPVYVSTNFGLSWRRMRENVKSFFWGVRPYDAYNTVYVEEKRGTRGNTVLRSDQYFDNHNYRVVIEGVEDFEVKDEYMFATKKQRLFGSRENSTLQFWVSYKRQDFVNAVFPAVHGHSDYYVADASEGQVMLCVVHNTSDTNLYISNVEGTRFSLSLERIVYFNPQGANKDTWLSIYYNESFADIHKVAGLRGIYIASQLIASGGALTLENQRSLITFDKGGQWSLLTAPTVMHGRSNRNCSKKVVKQHWSKAQLNNCSLHLSQEFTRLYPNSQSQPIMSLESAPGLILASGAVGNSLKNQQDMFVSHDAGFTWYQVMEGNYMFSMADHGGVMLAARQFQPTDSVYYSSDEGETWHVYKFTNESAVRLYGILTEPGEKTTVFSLFGSKPDHHSWIVFQLNVSGLLPYRCQAEDYKSWSLPDALPGAGCLLGQKLVIQRRIAHAACYNGHDFVRVTNRQNCSCTRNDFECDFGYQLREGFFSQTCVKDNISDAQIHRVPDPCPPGTFYAYTRGYRKVAGDTCSGGREHRYAPRMFSCPVRERSEFVVLAFQDRIKTFDLGMMQWMTLYRVPSDQGVRISAVTFDYAKNQVFWSTSGISMIKSLSLNTNATDRSAKTLAEVRMAEVTSLAYDWTGDSLYWTDTRAGAIDMMRSNGHFRKRLLANHSMLVQPRQLVLDPVHGWMYWLNTRDYGTSNVMRAWMSGDRSSIQVVTNQPLSFPQGLALDLVHEHLYFTVLGNNSLFRMDLNGSDLTRLPIYAQRPGRIAVYKESLLWISMAGRQLYSDSLVLQTLSETVIDMMAVSHISQSAVGACTPPTAPCSQLCTPQPHPTDSSKQNRTCKCGDDFVFEQLSSNNQHCFCENRNEIVIDGYCHVNNATNATCNSDQLMCANGRCLPSHWRCDGDDDCGDMSEETDCPFYTCPSTAFRCNSGKCIPQRWKCDFDNDCGTGEDERNCTYRTCSPNEFRCDNQRCVSKSYICDMDNDCRDMSDERNCSTFQRSCYTWEWTCDSGECVSWFAKCNGHWDCSDGTDERNCSSNTTTCSSYQFKCKHNSQCIINSWVCDGDNDCRDGSDEQNCTTTVSSTTTAASRNCSMWEFACSNGYCVSYFSMCDGVNDCGDRSDERFCAPVSSSTPPPVTCTSNQFRCSSGQCIDGLLRCDNRTGDCWDNSDELECSFSCASSSFECYESNVGLEKTCIWESWVCDGDEDCPHGEDERYCNSTEIGVLCPSTDFKCVMSTGCIPRNRRCDGHYDCQDHSDEEDCRVSCDRYKNDRHACCQNGCDFLHCPGDSVEGCFSTDVSIGSSCSQDHNLCTGSNSSSGIHDPKYYFHCPYSDQWIPWMYVCNGLSDCSNHGDEIYCDARKMRDREEVQVLTEYSSNITVYWGRYRSNSSSYTLSYFPRGKPTQWTNRTSIPGSTYTITDLAAYTTYVISVYPVHGQTVGYPSSPLLVRTDKSSPKPPRNLQVKNDLLNTISVTWQAPAGSIYTLHYSIEITDTATGISKMRNTRDIQYMFSDLNPGHTYNILVRSVNEEGYGSKPTQKTFKYSRHQRLVLTASNVQKTSVTLTWHPHDGAKQYNVTAVLKYQDGRQITKTTKKPSYTFTKLCPGQTVYFTVEADLGGGIASFTSDPLNVTMKGTSIPVPSIKSVTIFNARNAKVIINKEASQTVVLYYKEHLEEDLGVFFKNAYKKNTKESTLTVTDLNACELYFFRVGNIYDTCPISSVVVKNTHEDDTAPPKHIKSRFLPKKGSPGDKNIQLLWNPPCDTMNKSVSYMISTSWQGMPSSRSDVVPPVNSSTKTYLWTNVTRGVTYHFKIRTDLPFSHYSRDLNVTMAPYPKVEGFYLQQEPNFTVVMNWEAPWDRPPTNFFKGYNVTIWQKKKLVETKIITSKPLRQNVTEGHFNVSISMAVSNGPDGEAFINEFSYYPLDGSGDGNNDNVIKISKKNLVPILVPVCLVMVALVVVVMIFVVRHRRLQRSFLAFASSHYNSQSGTTTFSSDLDDDEPMIQGFSDDEPLVLA